MDDQVFKYGESKALSGNGYSLTGYSFGGWNTMSDGKGTGYSDKGEVKNLSSTDGATVTLYAQWVQGPVETFKVTFNPNGGSGEM
jgi:hypothetical protein